MDNYWWCAILFRIILPLIVVIAVSIRPTVTSYVYLLVGCYMPFFSVPTSHSLAHSTGTYMKILIITCTLTSCFMLSFYFVLYFPTEPEFDLKPCSPLESALRTMGVVEFEGLDFSSALPWCLSEPLMLLTSVVLFFIFKKLCQDTTVSRMTKDLYELAQAKEEHRKNILSMLMNFGKYFVVLLCCVTGVLKATVFGAIYYFVFLFVMTYWACNQTLGRFFARVLVSLTPIIFLNMTIMFWYQFQYFYDSKVVTADSVWGRLFNLIAIKTYKDCKDPRIFQFHAQTKSVYAIPICLFFLYVLSVLVSREILQAKVRI
uniref:Piezo TM1-24 domain-containing protein n=1 Tax=Dendroctonus ponderosae TaxID=77166 RepID=A0AAR5PG41_DENPD